MNKRVFIIVLDSFGIGEAPDAYKWKDEGSNTLGAIRKAPEFCCPELEKSGLFNIDGVGGGVTSPEASFARLEERSQGKDTTIGHWEIAGIVSDNPLPVFPDGFPPEIIEKFEKATGRKTICNKPYSGTEVIKDYGEESIKSGALIVYTSADSVFQVAAHEDAVPVAELYEYCEIARKILTGKFGVGRVIARPFNGVYPFTRTSRRHDFSIKPPAETMLDRIKGAGMDVLSVGKIIDIFAGQGITEFVRTVNNDDGMDKTAAFAKKDFHGLCFTNLVDFDMVYGHRNDVAGYAAAATAFDKRLKEFIPLLKEDDMVIITADHGCDPATPSTDHSREYVPMLVFGKKIKKGINLKTRKGFCDISATVLAYLGVPQGKTEGISFLSDVYNG